VSGLVPDNSSWAFYTPRRWATNSNYGVRLAVLNFPGTDLYVYLRRCTDDNPIGAGTPNNPVHFFKATDSGVYKQLGPLAHNTCFRMTARKDWTGFWGSTWWTGTLRY
jgi:hypothetical protein